MEKTQVKENCTRRMALTLKPTDYDRLVTLAKVTGKLPAVAAREILIRYLDRHSADVEEAQKAAAQYQVALQALNAKQISLFPNDEATV